jgi:hypothetical protein
MDRDAATGIQRGLDQGDDAAILQLLLERYGVALCRQGELFGDEIVRASGSRAVPCSVNENGTKRRARPRELRGKIVHL